MSTHSAADELSIEEETATTSPPTIAELDQDFSDYIPLRISAGVSLLREWSSQDPSSATLPALRARADRTINRWETHLASLKAECTQYETTDPAKASHIRERISRREDWISGLKGAIFMWETAHAPVSSPEGSNAGSTGAASASASHTPTANIEVIEVIDLTDSSTDDAIANSTPVRGGQSSTGPPPRMPSKPRRSVVGSLCRWSIIVLIGMMLIIAIKNPMPETEVTSAQGPSTWYGGMFEKPMERLLAAFQTQHRPSEERVAVMRVQCSRSDSSSEPVCENISKRMILLW